MMSIINHNLLFKEGGFSINHTRNIQNLLSIASILEIMSKLMYVKKLEVKKEQNLTTNHRTLIHTIVVVVGLSILIGVGFAYMGYTSGHFSEAYVLCKNDVLSQERIGVYQSANEITAALQSCNGVTS
jgi:hypothetical protein